MTGIRETRLKRQHPFFKILYNMPPKPQKTRYNLDMTQQKYSLKFHYFLAIFFLVFCAPTWAEEPPSTHELGDEDDGEVKATPKYEKATFKGYEIQEILDQAVMKKLGLKKGDLLVVGENGEVSYIRKGKKYKITQQEVISIRDPQ